MDDWLQQLEMEEYTDLFHAEGYRTEEDIENLKDLNAKELKKMGIHKRGMYSNYIYIQVCWLYICIVYALV